MLSVDFAGAVNDSLVPLSLFDVLQVHVFHVQFLAAHSGIHVADKLILVRMKVWIRDGQVVFVVNVLLRVVVDTIMANSESNVWRRALALVERFVSESHRLLNASISTRELLLAEEELTLA